MYAEIFDVSGHGLSENALNNIYDDVEAHEIYAQSEEHKTNETETVSEWGRGEALTKNELEIWTEKEEDTSVGIKQCGMVKNVELRFFSIFIALQSNRWL